MTKIIGQVILKIPLLLITILAFFLQKEADAQGCSDAGVCSFGMHEMNTEGDFNPSMKIGLTTGYGIADGGVNIITPGLRFGVNPIEGLSFIASIPYVLATVGEIELAGGGLIDGETTSGIGDLMFGATVNLYNNSEKIDNVPLYGGSRSKTDRTQGLDFFLGARIATGDTDIRSSNSNSSSFALPMPFQTGLGTNDLLARIDYRYESWSFSLGGQFPFGKIDNRFANYHDFSKDGISPSLRTQGEINAGFANFWSSSNQQRGADIMLRIDKNFAIDSYTLSAGVLPIYRIARSKFEIFNGSTGTDENGEKVWEVPSGNYEFVDSQGLTLNITGGLELPLSDNLSFSSNIGFPVMVRAARPDGTTRAFQLNLSIDWKIGL
ncbi:MAG: hypothetical protein Kapaf2KO_17730 [Candidatus Kapaibacteriales bacterium]